jgi:hypothetical protein
MFLSLLPELILFAGAMPDAVWKLCSLTLCVYSIVFLGWWISVSLEIWRADPKIFSRFAFIRMATGHVLCILVQVAFLASIFDSGMGAFAIGLVWYLMHSAQQFTRMLFVPTRSDVAA